MARYIASPLFNKPQINRIRDVEEMLSGLKIPYFSPRSITVDLSKLSQDLELKKLAIKGIFDNNIDHLDASETLVAILDWFDIGTLFEVGYFIAVFNPLSSDLEFYNNLNKSLTLLINKESETKVDINLTHLLAISKFVHRLRWIESIASVESTEFGKETKTEVVEVNRRTVDRTQLLIMNGETDFDNYTDVAPSVVAICIDDRPALLCVAMGILYKLQIPFITYSKKNYGNNVMISACSLGHIKLGEDETEADLSEYLNELRGNLIQVPEVYDRVDID